MTGVIEIVPTVYEDDRGVFVETFQRDRYRALGIEHEFVQDNFSRSSAGTLRGLHYQLRQPQGKLVWVTHGEVFDVAVDLRRDSPGFGTHHAVVLSGFRQVWIPPGFAHGFLVLSETAHVAYKVTAPYDPADQHSIRWDDPQLAIAWPITSPRLSEKDRTAPQFAEAVL